MSPSELEGRVAVVIGAASGIGRATAPRLAREGASVLVADVAETGGEKTAAVVIAAGGRRSSAPT